MTMGQQLHPSGGVERVMPIALIMLSSMWMFLSSWLLLDIAEATMSLTGYDIQQVCFDCCYGTHLNTYEGIQAVLSCSTVCSGDPKCKSWQFNPDNNECWTNGERMSTANTSCSRRVRYGESKEATFQSSWLDDKCRRDSECPIANSICRAGGKCECGPGYPYDRRTDTCPTECIEYGETVHGADYYLINIIPMSDSKSSVTFQQCLQYCFRATRFLCRYIAYSDRTPTKCRMYQYNARLAYHAVSFDLPGHWKSWDRNCL